MRLYTYRLAPFVAISCFICAPAVAQTTPVAIQPMPYDQVFSSIADTPVLDRAHPGYEPIGEKIADYRLFPQATVSEIYNDNLFATNTNQVGDFETAFDPEVSLSSDWVRNAFTADVKAHLERDFSRPNEAINNVEASVTGRYDGPDYFTVSGLADFAHLTETRSNPLSPRDVAQPIQYNVGHLQAELVKPIDRLRLSLTGDFYDTRYDNGVTPQGATVLETIYDSQVGYLDGRASYFIDQDLAAVLDVTGNDRSYPNPLPQAPPLAPLNRNSTGVDVSAGFNVALTHLLRGEVLVGYLDQNYQDSRAYRPVTGPSAHVKLVYLPTGLTTLSATFERKVNDAQDFAASSFLSSAGHLQIDHELYRYIIVSAFANYEEDQYKGIERTDKILDGRIFVTYLLDHHFSIRGYYDHLSVVSEGAARIPSYGENLVSLALTSQF